MLKRFPFFRQHDAMDCGPTCLRMVAAHYGKQYSLQYLREHSYIDREGVSLEGISEAAEHIGMRTIGIKIPFKNEDPDASSFVEVPLPCIVHWRQNHFVVVYKIGKKDIWIADPARGKVKISHAEFLKNWAPDGKSGIALLLETTPDFYTSEFEEPEKKGFKYLFSYLKPYRKLITQLIIGLLLGSIFQLIFPFLTQSIVDVGIQNHNIDFIWLILLGQLVLFISQTSVSFIQSWILLHIGTRINISLLSDFLIKLMKLPIGFFDSKMIGDLLQRIGDQRRIENFLTSSTLLIIFSMFNLVIFGIVLLIYNVSIFLIFLIAGILYVAWIIIFLKKRASIDYLLFRERAENQSTLIELIQGMQETKLQNSEKKRRWQWANIQARLFRINIKSMRIGQYQDAGAGFISQLKDIIITFIAAKEVLEGRMTLGMMLAVQYIIGQLNAPLQQMITFVRTAQDARLSLDRLGEIHEMEDEGSNQQTYLSTLMPHKPDFVIENLSFKYNKLSDYVLKNINLIIPNGKITAIVGQSGSGKTTLVKLLLGFYEPTEGKIRVGGVELKNIVKKTWRNKCGAVMQDGYIFSDTIANNIAESEDDIYGYIDRKQLMKAADTANILEFVQKMPLGFNTMVGPKGNSLSQGQKQRLLIARAVYKDPEFIFFDEATNALDAKNERAIMGKLDRFFENRTVVVVAHRLSTVKNADQIIVLDNGQIIEKGTHKTLTAAKGAYYRLVKDQLELGS